MEPRQRIRRLVHLLTEGSGGAKPATIWARTIATNPFPKGHELYGKEIIKTAQVNCMLNCNYEASVNRQREREDKEGTFEAEPLPYGAWVEGLPLIKHEKDGVTSIQLRVQPNKTLREEYTCEGKPVCAKLYHSFEKPKSSGRQGVEKARKVRNYKIENILSIKMNSKTVTF